MKLFKKMFRFIQIVNGEAGIWPWVFSIAAFPKGSVVKNLPAVQKTQEMRARSLSWEDLLEMGMATHSSILFWEIPWTGKPGRLQSMGLQRVRHN